MSKILVSKIVPINWKYYSSSFFYFYKYIIIEVVNIFLLNPPIVVLNTH